MASDESQQIIQFGPTLNCKISSYGYTKLTSNCKGISWGIESPCSREEVVRPLKTMIDLRVAIVVIQARQAHEHCESNSESVSLHSIDAWGCEGGRRTRIQTRVAWTGCVRGRDIDQSIVLFGIGTSWTQLRHWRRVCRLKYKNNQNRLVKRILNHHESNVWTQLRQFGFSC